jgi:hypothetical protein
VNRVLVAVVVALVVALGAIGILAGEGEESEPATERPRGESLEQVSERVEEVARDVARVRELQFDRLPRVRLVSPEEVTRETLRELDRNVPRRRQEIEERLMVMMGLLPPDVRLRELLGEALTQEVAGYYVPRTGTLALVRGAGLDGLLAEVALAHELTHALEDQRFGLESQENLFMRDREVADVALREGTATVAMVDYVAVSRGLGEALAGETRSMAMEQIGNVALPESSGLPRYVRESVVFPYAAGGRFVDHLEARGGWEAVNRAFGEDPPASTEQILHPRKYEADERPMRVRLRGVRSALPDGATAVARGDLGEFDTAQFLHDANGRRRAEEAAAGWGGSAFEMWRLPGGGDVLVMAWAWDSARDAAQFAAAAERSVQRLRSAGAVNGGNEGIVTVVLAPSAPLARRLARGIG